MLMLAMSLPGAVRALGLGDIRIDSALNEPLSAQIDIVGATREELIALTAKIANQDVFQHYGADRPSFLQSATFRVGVDSQGRPVLNVRSAEPFTDPVVSFLVDLRWDNGELIREYSLLLDPSGFGSSRLAALPATSDRANLKSATVLAPAAALGVDPRAAAMTSQPPVRAKTAKAAPLPQPTAGEFAGRHVVAAGETLHGIVRRAGASSEPDAQRMMIAVFRANPHAFEGNINLLHVGAVLRLPAESDVDAISPADARREVRAQMTAWRLDGRPATARRLAQGPAGAPHAADAQNPREGAAATGTLQGRVQSLELAINDLHQQLAHDSATLEDLKHETALAPAASAVTAASGVTAASAVPAASPVTAVSPVTAAAAAPTATGTAATVAPAPAGAVTAATSAAAEPGAPTQRAPAPAAVSVEVIQAAPRPAPILAAVATPNSEPSFSRGWTGLVAGGLALLVAGFAYGRRRAQKAGQMPAFAVSAPDRTDTPVVPIVQIVPGAMLGPAREIHQPVPIPRVVEPAPYRHAALDEPAEFRGDETGTLAAQDPFEPVPNDQTTQELAIDAEALERSYLDALSVDSLGIDTADTARNATADLRPADDPFADDPFAHDTSLPETSLPGMSLHDASEPDTSLEDTSRQDTSLHDTSQSEATGLETVAVDF
jgi:pilus assembly protein FimV